MNTQLNPPFHQHQRRGWPMMTGRMMLVLQHLRQSKGEGWPYVLLKGVYKSTLKALFERDWVFASPGNDGTRYGITERGERALKVYEPAGPRYDNICPMCGERAKHITKTGRKEAYCLPCGLLNKRRSYHLRRPMVKAGRMCSRCRKRAVHILASGRAISYCLPCNNLLKRRAKKRYHKAKLKRIQAGEVLLCTRPGCTHPRHTTPSCVYELCCEHYREWHNGYRHRKKANRVPGKPGRPRNREVQP